MPRFRTVFAALCVVGVSALIGSVWGANPAKVNGPYDVQVAGSLIGNGQITIGNTNVNVNIDVRDEKSGATGKFKAHLNLNNGYISGTGTALGVAANVSGRLEAPDGMTIKVARLLCNFGMADGRNGRMIGQHR